MGKRKRTNVKSGAPYQFFAFMKSEAEGWVGLWCLTPFSTIFQIFRG
jgi:hypothetical protein